jgi:hypothetical protein
MLPVNDEMLHPRGVEALNTASHIATIETITSSHAKRASPGSIMTLVLLLLLQLTQGP